MLRVNPLLLDVAIIMTHPHMFLIIFTRGQYGLYSVSYNTREINFAAC